MCDVMACMHVLCCIVLQPAMAAVEEENAELCAVFGVECPTPQPMIPEMEQESSYSSGDDNAANGSKRKRRK
jgi:hypothetical protein